MGEVYRARDPRLGREVAIKVLPASLSKDADRLRRFEQEARAAGILNHPNITAVYDIGAHEDAPYVVTELLEGETLRSRLAGGAVPVRKAIDYALQIAHGLAAAHEKGIVHRDLKPENLFLTKDGRVKILDFGLAKLTQAEGESGAQTNLPTATAGTEPGVVLGTLGYMSPEQVKGQPADTRSDIFAFGAILYEMLSGKRAFHRGSAAETMSAILKEEPPDLSATNQSIQPGLERIVRHCLEKNPEERFHSAHDLAFDLEALSGLSAPRLAEKTTRGRQFRLSTLAWLAALAAAAGLAYFVGIRKGRVPPPSFHQLTFRRGSVTSARFAADGQTVVYSARWEGGPGELFINRSESPESRPYGLSGADILAISRTGEMAVSLGRRVAGAFISTGTLAQVSVAGGTAPREILEDVHWADWAPDGASLAIVRDVNGRDRLEFPIGKVLYETAGWIGHPRVSPKGESVAFIDHETRGDDGGRVAVVSRSGETKKLTEGFESARGLAWSPDGREVWFTAALHGSNRALQAVSLSGRLRLLARVTTGMTLQDVSRDGRVLVTQDDERIGSIGRIAGEERERDLSWLDWSSASDLSPDGKTLLFFESGEGGGPGYSIYLRKTDGSPAVRLGEGAAGTLSPDGKWAFALVHIRTQPELMLLPTSAGEAKKLSTGSIRPERGIWRPGGKQIVITAREEGHGSRIFLVDVEGGKIRPISPEGYRIFRSISPDGRFIPALGPDRIFCLYPLAGGEPTPLPGLSPFDVPLNWRDERSFYVFRRGEVPAKVYLFDTVTGRKELWRELVPADASGVVDIVTVCLTPDGKSYVYSYARILSGLFLVEGVK
jgi:Tol biopolymer transport system component